MKRQRFESKRGFYRSPAMARLAARMVAPGEYVVILDVGGQKWTKKAKIRPMPGLD